MISSFPTESLILEEGPISHDESIRLALKVLKQLNPDAYYEDLIGAIVDFVNEAPDRPDYISFDVNDDGLLFTHDDD